VVLALEARAVSYRRCGHTLVQRVSVCVARGEFLAVVGHAGSGADTLVGLLAGNVAPDHGRVLVDGRTRPGRPRPPGADARRFGAGVAGVDAVVADAPPRSILLFDLVGSSADVAGATDAHHVARRCRAAADAGHAVVAAVEDPREITTHAHTLAVMVAGRLVHWAPPALVMSPALRLFEPTAAP
jgi:ABC-type hemin transport system ATPase subunit